VPAIEVTDLRKRYGAVEAVAGISFEAREGETFGLLGPNGAGKTTTLEIVEGLRSADSGSVRLLGQSPWPRNVALVRRIGVQLQSTAFFENLTAREQLRLFAGLYDVPPGRADETLDVVGLRESAGVLVDRLSGGQRQRLSIACALVHDPEVVFLDEPTAALDPQARRNLWDLIRSIRREGRTVVLTTHHLDEAEALCERVGIVDGGRLLALDTPAALVAGLEAPPRISFAAGGGPEPYASLPGAFDVAVEDGLCHLSTTDPAATLAVLAERGALQGLTVSTATLEDVFLQLTGREYRA
jgi:ABC-2 type transport system ATP-binding protein